MQYRIFPRIEDLTFLQNIGESFELRTTMTPILQYTPFLSTFAFMTKPKIIECPRDAMQGIKDFIPTSIKAEYINLLLQCGFDTLDFGSFVSPKAIPQMRDTAEVLAGLNIKEAETKLLSIVGNKRGALQAVSFEEIQYLGFPFSISETFLKRNINSTIKDSLDRIEELQNICVKNKKELVVYISMGFGNPYDEPWDVEIVAKACHNLYNNYDVKIISLSDTIGTSTPDTIDYLFKNLIPALSEVELGAHLHTTPDTWEEKMQAAISAGCYRFDGALKGYGGCPMAKDDLTGNMPTENIIQLIDSLAESEHPVLKSSGILQKQLKEALLFTTRVFTGLH